MGMEKTRKGAFHHLAKLFSHAQINADLFDELEEIFVMADIGVETVISFVDELKADVRMKNIQDAKELQPLIVDKMFDIYLKGEILRNNLEMNPNGLSVYLFVGVNGVGKTTTIAKIAHKLIQEKKKVLIAAGDTFRAGATEQLTVWGNRLGVDVIKGRENTDPSSVIFDAIQTAKAQKVDVLLCDTAGRLQTKVNLMKELEKIKRVIAREVENGPQETLLVIDATTGQNGLNQAKALAQATDVSGIVLTKLDGTAKGGIVLAIREKYNIPIKFVGLGERLEDLEYFDIEKYVYGLFAEIIDEE
ncbi:MAG: signal recognition particle-docking protein FtsY [Bacilli bacterium]|nr:signal recognition particle-docking protein FtsY [Bacilli bacterium]